MAMLKSHSMRVSLSSLLQSILLVHAALLQMQIQGRPAQEIIQDPTQSDLKISVLSTETDAMSQGTFADLEATTTGDKAGDEKIFSTHVQTIGDRKSSGGQALKETRASEEEEGEDSTQANGENDVTTPRSSAKLIVQKETSTPHGLSKRSASTIDIYNYFYHPLNGAFIGRRSVDGDESTDLDEAIDEESLHGNSLSKRALEKVPPFFDVPGGDWLLSE